jgi:hypothetical protein
MDFRLTEDQLLFADSVREYLAGTHGAEVLRRLDLKIAVGSAWGWSRQH